MIEIEVRGKVYSVIVADSMFYILKRGNLYYTVYDDSLTTSDMYHVLEDIGIHLSGITVWCDISNRDIDALYFQAVNQKSE